MFKTNNTLYGSQARTRSCRYSSLNKDIYNIMIRIKTVNINY